MRRHRHDEDPVIDEYFENYRRAAALLLAAVSSFVAWAVMSFLSPESHIQIAAFAAIRAVLGWACVTTFALTVLQSIYAFAFLRLVARNE